MARLELCVLALLVAGGFSNPLQKPQQKVADHDCLERQHKVMTLFFHVHEPNHVKQHLEIQNTWDLDKNTQLYENATAVKHSVYLLTHNWTLPQGVPFLVTEFEHRFQAETFFNLLYSAKSFESFYNTAIYLRARLNEYLFIDVLTTAVFHRHDTQDLVVPPLYSVFPSFFFNSEVMTTAQRITTHRQQWVEHYPSTYLWNENVVIRPNKTIWPYITKELPVTYFTHDPALNYVYYTLRWTYPYWLGQSTRTLAKDRRGELFWWWHRQLLSRYYMERLSNGLGEIPELDWDVVEEGYSSGLSYWNGIPFPSRPDHFHLHAPEVVEKIQEIEEYESRIRDAVDKGFIVTPSGNKVSIRGPDAIDILGRLIEANVDSPNPQYYKNFVNIWKKVLGNSQLQDQFVHFYKGIIPLVVPSALELHQTALRDPAFYMIWKRVMKLFDAWHETLPHYTPEELTAPVEIEKVDVDKLVTYFEYTRLNITNELYLNEFESEHLYDTKSVLVERPRLNHKVFTVRVNVKSEVQQHVTVRFFLAPKYDSIGREIPLHLNSHNFFELDKFEYVLSQGENVVTRLSTEIRGASNDLFESIELYEKVFGGLNGKGEYVFDEQRKYDAFPRRLLLPKGRIGGMPFVLMVYISEYHAPAVPYGTGFDPITSLGLGSGARRLTSDPLGFPVDRPLYEWQVADLKNIWFQDVFIHHRHTPEVVVDHVH